MSQITLIWHFKRSILKNEKGHTKLNPRYPKLFMNATTTMKLTRMIVAYPSGTYDKSSALLGDPVLCSRPTPRRAIEERFDAIGLFGVSKEEVIFSAPG